MATFLSINLVKPGRAVLLTFSSYSSVTDPAVAGSVGTAAPNHCHVDSIPLSLTRSMEHNGHYRSSRPCLTWNCGLHFDQVLHAIGITPLAQRDLMFCLMWKHEKYVDHIIKCKSS